MGLGEGAKGGTGCAADRWRIEGVVGPPCGVSLGLGRSRLEHSSSQDVSVRCCDPEIPPPRRLRLVTDAAYAFLRASGVSAQTWLDHGLIADSEGAFAVDRLTVL